jgi:hypothetical protein
MHKATNRAPAYYWINILSNICTLKVASGLLIFRSVSVVIGTKTSSSLYWCYWPYYKVFPCWKALRLWAILIAFRFVFSIVSYSVTQSSIILYSSIPATGIHFGKVYTCLYISFFIEFPMFHGNPGVPLIIDYLIFIYVLINWYLPHKFHVLNILWRYNFCRLYLQQRAGNCLVWYTVTLYAGIKFIMHEP